jgi:hypothetical protein
VIVERDRHPEKQPWQSRWILEGRQIDESDGQLQKAKWATDESREPDSNVTVARDSHPEKPYSPSVSTEEGIEIVASDLQSSKT